MTMSYYMSTTDQYVSYFPDEKLYASMEVGSNGDIYGDPTYSAGDDQNENLWGYQTWDANTTNGFDTGEVCVQFFGCSDGREQLSVGDGALQSYTGDSFGAIRSVQIQAGVMI